MLLILFLAKLSSMNAGLTFLSSSNGQLGVMVITPYCCLPWVHWDWSLESSRETHFLGPLLVCFVLHKVVNSIAADSICSQLSFHSWYMDDGVIAGPKQAALQALSIIKQLGPPLGLFIDTSKCELFSKGGLRGFPDEMKISYALNFEILGMPIGDPIFCAKSIVEKRENASKFLAVLKEVGSVDSQVALLLLRQWGGFCRMVHIARCTPPSVALEGLHLFDEGVHQTFSDNMCIDPSDLVWQRAQLSLSRDGLGLRSASAAAAFMSSFSMSGFATNTSHHLPTFGPL